MFEGTDLNSAYGFEMAPQSQQPLPPPEISGPVRQQPKQMVSVQQPGEIPYQPPQNMYVTEPQVAMMMPTESFWDRVSAKRYEVLKVFVLALIVLLALSMDHMLVYYLTQYVSNSLLTTTQEFLVRFSYPVAILLVIWFIKSM